MNIEELLREKLQAGSVRFELSPGFEDRVHRSLAPRAQSQWRADRILAGLVAIAAVVALVAASLPWLMGPRSRVEGGAEAGSPSLGASAGATDSPLPVAPVPGATLVHGHIWNLTLDYPVGWSHFDAGYGINPDTHLPTKQPGSVALGTLGPAQESWAGPGGTWTTAWSLAAGSVAMTFEWGGAILGQTEWAPGSLVAAAWATAPAGSQKVIVGGVPALFARSDSGGVPFGSTVLSGQKTIPGADEVLVWKLTSHYDVWHDYSVTAAIRGPNVAELEAQVQAVMASLRYVDPITPLADDAASRQAGLVSFFNELAADSTGRDTSCFPREPGVTATATITVTEVTARSLSLPLAVRCTSHIEAMPEEAWKITLTYSWDAAQDHAAGTATDVEVYLPGYGSAGLDTGFDKMPYAIPPSGGNG